MFRVSRQNSISHNQENQNAFRKNTFQELEILKTMLIKEGVNFLSMYVKGSVLRKTFGISSTTLQKWANDGHIECIRLPGSGQRIYSKASVERFMQLRSQGQAGRTCIIYARVSSQHQRPDLERQIRDLKTAYPDHELIQDIGSGLNYNRPGLQTLLERIRQGRIQQVAVMHRDRLCRYGIEIMEWIFKTFDTKLLVHSKNEDVHQLVDDTRELSEDLLSVVNFFVARHNGRRSAENRKRRREESSQEEEKPAKRPRGRPRKTATTSTEASA